MQRKHILNWFNYPFLAIYGMIVTGVHIDLATFETIFHLLFFFLFLSLNLSPALLLLHCLHATVNDRPIAFYLYTLSTIPVCAFWYYVVYMSIYVHLDAQSALMLLFAPLYQLIFLWILRLAIGIATKFSKKS